MDEKMKLPQRRSIRLKNYDYSRAGAYFITICVSDRKRVLSEIVKTDSMAVDCTLVSAVGEGLAPPAYSVKLKPCGEIAEEQMKSIETRFPDVCISDYVIMPDHIHAIVFLQETAGGASPSPTLSGVVGAFKSLTSRNCKQRFGIEKLFERSFADHIIRDREDYETRRTYIYENPQRWYFNHKKED